jgi:mannose-6-phosphate isomerase class I
MSDASKINSKDFLQKMEDKKQKDTLKDIEDSLSKLQNMALSPIQAKYEVAKLNAIVKDVQINTDMKSKISDTIKELEKKVPDIQEMLDKELLKAIEETLQGFTGEGMSTSWAKNDNTNFSASDEFDPYKIDGKSTLSTFL